MGPKPSSSVSKRPGEAGADTPSVTSLAERSGATRVSSPVVTFKDWPDRGGRKGDVFTQRASNRVRPQSLTQGGGERSRSGQ
jgi:hypothetical protein